MNRRTFLRVSAAAVGALVARQGVLHAAEARRPNLLYIMTDQQAALAMSCTGNPHLKTPALDGLAAEGCRFDAAYTAFPLCVPARFSMFTGRMPHEGRVFCNVSGVHEPYPFPMVGRVLADAGYRCHYLGKWHLTAPPKAAGVHGFETVRLTGPRHDAAIADAATAFLANPPAEPFFLVASFVNPHDCCQLARGEALPEGPIPPLPADDDLPPLPDNFAMPDAEPDALRAYWRDPAYRRVHPSCEWSPIQFRRYLWGYYRLVEMVDGHVGRILDAWRASGRSRDTVVVFAADHGDGTARHHWNQKKSLYDEVACVPLIVAGPGVAAGRVERRPVSASLDLAATLCDYAGASPPAGLLGVSLRSQAEGREQAAAREFVASETGLAEWHPIGVRGFPLGRMIRSERYKYIAFDRGDRREQLFDMSADPGELHDLSADVSHAAALAAHRRMLRQWCERTADDFGVAGE